MTRVPLRNRQRETVAYALIDDIDADRVLARNWCRLSTGYAMSSIRLEDGTREGLLLHRFVMGLVRGDGLEVDHKDGNRLDNRRSNLRVTTRAQNAQNRRPDRRAFSQYRGVGWDKKLNRWRATAHVAGRTYYLGAYDDELTAARAAARFRAERMTHTVEDAELLGTFQFSPAEPTEEAA